MADYVTVGEEKQRVCILAQVMATGVELKITKELETTRIRQPEGKRTVINAWYEFIVRAEKSTQGLDALDEKTARYVPAIRDLGFKMYLDCVLANAKIALRKLRERKKKTRLGLDEPQAIDRWIWNIHCALRNKLYEIEVGPAVMPQIDIEAWCREGDESNQKAASAPIKRKRGRPTTSNVARDRKIYEFRKNDELAYELITEQFPDLTVEQAKLAYDRERNRRNRRRK